MCLSNEEIEKIREELDSCKKPLFFFHDDPDGVCSFLQFYRYKREGKGVIVKSNPVIDEKFIRKVEEYNPDKIFVLDIAVVEQEFIDSVKQKIIWIDHHQPLKRSNVSYFNPRNNDIKSNPPVSYICNRVVENDDWIALVGFTGDWYFPKDIERFKEKYPDLLPENIEKPEDALYTTRLGVLTRVFAFILKGTTSEAMKSVKILTRIDNYNEILRQTTSKGRFIWKRYEKIKKEYEELLKEALKNTEDNLIVFSYDDNKMSFTGDLANELQYKFPEKIIIVCRRKSGEMKCSLRSKNHILPDIINKSLHNIEGRGGGHEHASGAVIKQEDFAEFIENFKKEIKALKYS